jgi:uncharacterized integral membrane protein
MADRSEDTSPPRDRTDQIRTLALGALIVLAILFALLNLEKVKVDLILGSPRIPLILVILACLAAGVAIDRLLLRRRHRSG